MPILIFIAIATLLKAVGVGGALYEFIVVDAVWPRRPSLVAPREGGLERKRFWIPAHVLFEVALLVSLLLAWQSPDIRNGLLWAFASHVLMRLWSALDFIPKALAFEKRDASTIEEGEARAWTRRSLLRLPLDLAACSAMVCAFAFAAQAA